MPGRGTQQHSKQQFEGLFRGMGTSSREPVCNRRNTETRKCHFETHFAIGSMKWDEGNRESTTTHDAFNDPQVTFATRDAPYKNASIVELRQTQYDGSIHFRTEQRERYAHGPPRPRQTMCDPGVSQVHLGDDRPEMKSQMAAAHFTAIDREEADLGRALRHAGCGTLIPTSHWPKGVRCNPVTGGPRTADAHDLGVDEMSWPFPTANQSNIIAIEAVRDPILGHSVPTAALKPPGLRTTREIVEDFNTNVPALHSLGTLRPSSRGPF